MTDREGFLSRWSRRKRQAAEEAESEQSLGVEKDENRAEPNRDIPQESIPQSLPRPEFEAAAPGESAIDLSALPPLESISATTDIRPFLAPGIPLELRRAALRRVWLADPQIRDFVGIAENQWDFNAADGVPGFASLSADDALRVAEQFLEQASEAEPTSPTAAGDEVPLPRGKDEATTPDGLPEAPPGDKTSQGVTHAIVSDDDRGHSVQCSEGAAAAQETERRSPENDSPRDLSSKRTVRRRGSALPRL